MLSPLSTFHLHLRYAVRTVLGPFDHQFNAITGLNGSGKSNVLDGICFVLGITNLSKVRATNLSELVYKQGQAGITKASVTIIFNNLDKSRSPVGFENMDSISVSRQVVIGGRNRYLLNGKAAQLQEINNLFHSVQLNINNPHFLIMQGSITKVINMKPPEILGMIEEAAGTGMYESKKTIALRTLDKKQLKVDEIDRIIKDEIGPQMEKLKAEKAVFIEWSNLVQKADELEKSVISWEYRNVAGKLEGGGGQFDQTQSDLEKWTVSKSTLQSSLAKAERQAESDTKSLEKQKAQQVAIEERLEEDLKLSKRKLVEIETNIKDKSNALKSYNGKQLKSKSTEKKLEDRIETTTNELGEISTSIDSAKAESDQVELDLKSKQQAVADMESGADGSGSLQSDLVSKKTSLERLNAELKTITIREKGINERLRNLKSTTSRSAEFEKFQEEKSALVSRKTELEKKLAECSFSPDKFHELNNQIRDNERKLETLRITQNQLSSAVNQRLDIPFDTNAFGGAQKIKGMIAKLFSIKPEYEKYIPALETLLGGKLFNVVVDSETTSKKLLASDKLKKRITFLPLDKIQGKRIDDAQNREAIRIGKERRGECLAAIDSVNYPEEIVRAIEFVLGNTFVCDKSEIGKQMTFNENLPTHLRVKTMTVDGDVFDPRGSLSGGSDGGRSTNGQTALLKNIFSLQRNHCDVQEIEKQTGILNGECQRMITARKEYDTLSKELQGLNGKLAMLDSKLKGTAQSRAVEEIESLEGELTQCKQRTGELETERKSVTDSISAIEKELKEFSRDKDSKLKELQVELTNLKKLKKKTAESLKSQEAKKSQLSIELKSAQEELRSFIEDMSNQAGVNDSLEREITALEETGQNLRDQIETLTSKLKESKITKKSFETAILEVVKSLKDTKSQLDEAEVQVTKLTALMASLSKERKEAKTELERLEREYAWLRAERAAIIASDLIGQITKSEIEKKKSKLTDLKDEVNIRGKSINRRILPLVERCEKETEELLTKRAALEDEKKQIHEFINELDDKKGRALSRTWQIVNSNFGAIFRSLLPMVDAKLAPPEGMTALEGLELKVQLGSVWKDSLTELSGGQKSLLALSLVLALLLFKPAPFYILDEVDAALDVSHTRNIGKMIKQHFPHSQFVIVSLKDGMFNNANVLYRVRFENGTSVVARTTQQSTVTDAPSIDLKENVPIDETEMIAAMRRKSNSKKVAAPKKSKKKQVSDDEAAEASSSDVEFSVGSVPPAPTRASRRAPRDN
jgi:structural maintenance of chromosome 2